jgi:hypothetical protein
LRYVAGAIFEAAGERERRRRRVPQRARAGLDARAARRPAGTADSGTVLVILEQGFVAHRVEQALAVLLLPEEVEAIAHGAAETGSLRRRSSRVAWSNMPRSRRR